MPTDPLPYPVCEYISRNVLATVAGVRTLASFRVDLVAERAKRPPSPPARGLAVVYEGDDQPAADDDTPIGMAAWLRPYVVVVYGQGAEGSDEPYDTYLNVARADVERALMADHGRGGYARNTILRPPLKVEDPNDVPAILVSFDVEYETVDGDAYRLG